jgi:hypothetical protein
MLSRLVDKLNLRERALARKPLAHLLQWALIHATRPYFGHIATDWMVDAIKNDARRLLLEMADRGAFLFFGIRNAEEFGSPAIGIMMLDDGHLVIEYEPLTDWIFGGGAGRHGWRSTRDFNLED